MQEWNINHPNIVSALEEFGVEAPSDIVDLKPAPSLHRRQTQVPWPPPN
jgi:hypothetical protein